MKRKRTTPIRLKPETKQEETLQTLFKYRGRTGKALAKIQKRPVSSVTGELARIMLLVGGDLITRDRNSLGAYIYHPVAGLKFQEALFRYRLKRSRTRTTRKHRVAPSVVRPKPKADCSSTKVLGKVSTKQMIATARTQLCQDLVARIDAFQEDTGIRVSNFWVHYDDQDNVMDVGVNGRI